MANAPIDGTKTHFGPGVIMMAAVGTAVPVLTAAANAFTNSLPWAGWTAVGMTVDGLTIIRNPASSQYYCAESYYPVKIGFTSDSVNGATVLSQVSRANLAFAFNGATVAGIAGTGGVWATSTGAASGASLVSGLSLPLIGAEVRSMLAWVAQDDSQAAVLYQALNTASLAPHMAKFPGAQEIALAMECELPATNLDTQGGMYTSTQVEPYRHYFAGSS